MDIESFYNEDERRRASRELELGDRWLDARGLTHTLSYVVDTGEAYLMAAPAADVVEDGFGDIRVDRDEPVDELVVEIVAVVPTSEELHRALGGWEEAVGKPDSVAWVREHLSAYAPH